MRCENFALYRNKRLLRTVVIKEFAHAFSCAYIELWMHLGSLESTQKARLAAAPRATLTHFLCSPNFLRASITRYTHAKNEQILQSLIARARTDDVDCVIVSQQCTHVT